ncbi:hypothetical protein [Cellulosimicrobium arenosum]|uniref:Uncharacterized protein n=1 Tax=Cellulosimicrobium arenosum TaxID=2708133 RepID=A0A927IZB2_9MICO|nr:hypothetical protein [Cellulosimicrobium arenosum]MBD8078399.1 hypothetical protein [Cellulosimicrobium arenosum]
MSSILRTTSLATAVAVLVVVSLIGAVALWRDGRRAVETSAAARRAVRHSALTAGVAAVPLAFGICFVPVYYAAGTSALTGHLAAALPTVSLLGLLAVHAVGELTWPRPRGAERRARLVARTPADVAPGRLRQTTLAWWVALVVTSLALGLLASGPRWLSGAVDLDLVRPTTPFPGWSWTVPIMVTTTLAVVATALVLRLVASRPAVEDVSDEWDMWLRRRVARRMLRSVQLVLGLTLAGLVGMAGIALRWIGLANGLYAGPPVSPGHVAAGNVLLVVGLATAVVALALAFWPAHDPAPQPIEQPATPAARA